MKHRLGLLCLVGMLYIVSPAFGEPGSHSISPQPLAHQLLYADGQENPSTMDKVYNQLLIEMERFEAVWKQQPHNMAALKRYSSQVRSLLDSLSTLNEQPRQSESGGAITAGSSTIPAGKENTSSGSSSTGHIEATEGTFRGGPFNSSPPTQTLAALSDSWISGACDMAEQQLTLLDQVLNRNSFDASNFEGALGQLSATVQRIANPPQMKPPTTPRG